MSVLLLTRPMPVKLRGGVQIMLIRTGQGYISQFVLHLPLAYNSRFDVRLARGMVNGKAYTR